MMEKKLIFLVFFILFLCIIPSCTQALTYQDDNDVALRLHGGIGVHFIIRNNSPMNLSVNYTIKKGYDVQTGDIWAPEGKTTIRSFFPITFVSTLLVTIETGNIRETKTGWLIGCFAILI